MSTEQVGPKAAGPSSSIRAGEALQGVTRALRVLRLFAHEDALGARAVGDRLDLNSAVAHRILTTLAAEGFLTQDPDTRAFKLGWAAGELGDAYYRSDAFGHRAREVLGRLSAATGETAALQVLRDGCRVCRMQHESPQRLRYAMPLDTPMPITNGATDQVIRAFADEYEGRAIRQAIDRVAADPETIAMMSLDLPATLAADFDSVSEAQLGRVRRDGWAQGYGRRESGVGSVAVPARCNGELHVLTVFGPQDRIAATDTDQLVSLLRQAAAGLAGEGAPK